MISVGGQWRVWAAALLFAIWLTGLTFIVFRHSYLLADHELRLSVQIGMTLSEAARYWGRPPGHVWTASQAANDDRVPQSFRQFTSGRVALFGRIWPSSYLWVHLDSNGYVDRVLFIRS